MSKFSKWMKGTLALMLALLLLAGGAIVVIDPLFHYHARLPGLAYPFDNEYYQNPGIAQNFKYDSLLTGSSVTVEFKPSLFKELTGTEMVKVNHSDASPFMLRKTLTLALEANPQLKTVYYGLDHWALPRNPDKMFYGIPDYLYDHNPFNDTAYVLNKQVLLENTAGVVANTLGDKAYADFDTAYTQDYHFITRESVAVAEYLKTEAPASAEASAAFDYDLMVNTTTDNLQKNILPLVTAYPEVDFVFFFTPGSVLYWYDIITYKSLDGAFVQINAAIEALIDQPNVRLYNFMGVEELVCNLYNYFDWIHYRAEVHEYMTHSMVEDRHRLTPENWRDEIAAMRTMIETYDYDALFRDEVYPFKAAGTLYDYAQALTDPRYTVLVAGQGQAEMSAPVAEALAALGLEGCAGQGAQYYTAASRGGKALAEQAGAEPQPLQVPVGAQTATLQSGQETQAGVTIGNVQYAQWLPGLNIVVWDNETNRVVDSAAFAPEETQPAPQRRTDKQYFPPEG